METMYPRNGERLRACARVCVWGWSVGMAKYVCLKGRQTFLQGMTGIKEDEEVCSSLCVPMGGREVRARTGVFVCSGGSCRRLLPNPINSYWMLSFVYIWWGKEKKKDRRKKKAESPEVQYLVCINLWPIPPERLVIISIPPSVRRTSAALLWHVGLGNEKDKPWSFQTPTPVEEAHGPRTAPMSTTSPGKRCVGCVRCVWGGAVYASHPQGLLLLLEI